MPKKVRQFCEACNQITTQVKEKPDEPWKCLCCESAKFRSQQETEEIKKRDSKKAKLNISF